MDYDRHEVKQSMAEAEYARVIRYAKAAFGADYEEVVAGCGGHQRLVVGLQAALSNAEHSRDNSGNYKSDALSAERLEAFKKGAFADLQGSRATFADRFKEPGATHAEDALIRADHGMAV